MPPKPSYLSARVPPEKKRTVKAIAARRGVSVQTLMNDLVDDLIKREVEPDLGKVIGALRGARNEFASFGVVHLFVHGALARGEASVGQDIEVFADFLGGQGVGMVTVGSVQRTIEQVLGLGVDFCDRTVLPDPIKSADEAVQVF